jgi:AraC-like DNA-binding protein
MTDRLSALLYCFRLQSRVFHSGTLCTTADFDDQEGVGHLHVLRNGRLRIFDAPGGERVIDTPSLIFYARPSPHWIRGEGSGADLVCASVRIGADVGNPIVRSLPPVLIVPLASMTGMQAVLDLLFDEAFAERCGRQAALDRLSELLILQLLRYCMNTGVVDSGVFAGLSDPRLAKTLNAIHEQPGAPWTLDTMAQTSGMSRARFAAHFRDTLGITPGDYLTDWRLSIAKTLLKRGQAVKHIAQDVGYGNASALARAFAARHDGASPTEWLAGHR